MLPENAAHTINIWTDDSAITITATQPMSGSREDGHVDDDIHDEAYHER